MIGRKARWPGMGQTTTAATASCDNFLDMLFNPKCLAQELSLTPTGAAANAAALSAAAGARFPPPPPPVAEPGPQTELQLTGAAPWTPDQAAAAWSAAQKQQTLDFFKSLTPTGYPTSGTPGNAPPPPDCTSLWTYYTNPTCPVDCSRFFTNLFNSSCPGLGLGGLTMPLAIAAGVLLLVVVIRR